MSSSTPNRRPTCDRFNESDDEECTSSSSFDPTDSAEESSTSSRVCVMHNLRKKIATLKAQIMKNLESHCDKAILDEKIVKLQELQRKYVNLEKRIVMFGGNLANDHECCLTDREIGVEMTSSDESQLCGIGLVCAEPNLSRSVSERNISKFWSAGLWHCK